MTQPDASAVVFTAAARRGMNRLPPAGAVALFEHLAGPVAENPYRLGKPLDAPLEELRSTRRGEYRALYVVDDEERGCWWWPSLIAATPIGRVDHDPAREAISSRCAPSGR